MEKIVVITRAFRAALRSSNAQQRALFAVGDIRGVHGCFVIQHHGAASENRARCPTHKRADTLNSPQSAGLSPTSRRASIVRPAADRPRAQTAAACAPPAAGGLRLQHKPHCAADRNRRGIRISLRCLAFARAGPIAHRRDRETGNAQRHISAADKDTNRDQAPEAPSRQEAQDQPIAKNAGRNGCAANHAMRLTPASLDRAQSALYQTV